jgi:ADP-heptose:LPS heptosyltransferase
MTFIHDMENVATGNLTSEDLTNTAIRIRRKDMGDKVGTTPSARISLTARTETRPRFGKPRRPLTGKYRAQNPILVLALRLLDLLGKFHARRASPLPTNRPIRILVANWAHLGDVVAMLPMLKHLEQDPRIGEIGILVGSWSQCVVSELPFIQRIHCLDHFLLDRGPRSRIGKIYRYFLQQKRVIREIKDSHYDASVDLFTVFPPTHRLLWKARIPTRIGFECTGLGSYLTHPFKWVAGDEYILAKQLRLLEPIFGSDTPRCLAPTYPNFVRSDVRRCGLTPDRKYVVVHIGSGDYRSWPLRSWIELGRALKERGADIVLTGAKGVEAKLAGEVAEKIKAQCVAGMLSWNEFVTVVSNAATLISVDTVTGHIAACFGIPSIILLSGRWGTTFFRPNSSKAVTLTYPVGCSPCYRSTGCASMACVRMTSVQDVLRVFDDIAIGH